MFENVKFYAERANGHRTSARTGVVLVVSQRAADMNGTCYKALATPKGQPNAVPSATWVAPGHLAKRCDEITEKEARAINPGMFAHIEKFERAPEYRAMHAAEIARAVERGVYAQQPADDRVIDRMAVNRPKETRGEAGYGRENGRPYWGK